MVPHASGVSPARNITHSTAAAVSVTNTPVVDQSARAAALAVGGSRASSNRRPTTRMQTAPESPGGDAGWQAREARHGAP